MKLLFHGVGVYAEGKRFGPARWPHHDLLIVQEGGVLLRTPKGELHLSASDGVLIPPGLHFEGSAVNGKIMIWVLHFRELKLKAQMFTPQREAGLWVFREGISSDLAEALMERLHQTYQGESRWAVHGERYLSALLAEMSRNRWRQVAGNERWLNDLEQWARERLGQGITVNDLAAHSGLSASHFRKLFRERTNSPAGRFLRELRMEEARNLLQQTTMGLKEIAFRLGYSDAVAVHHAFAARFRRSPSAFRKMAMSAV